MSEAFALAKGTESPPVTKDSVANYSPPSPSDVQGTDLRVLIVDDNDINLKVCCAFCHIEVTSDPLDFINLHAKD